MQHPPQPPSATQDETSERPDDQLPANDNILAAGASAQEDDDVPAVTFLSFY
jgi:hypothetical protein